MDFGEGWFSWLIFILIIVIFITIGMKILLEYPGLADVKCVYVEETDEEFPKDDKDLIKMKEYDVTGGLSKDTSIQFMPKNERMSKSLIRKEDIVERIELKYCSDNDEVDDAHDAIKVSKESVKDVRRIFHLDLIKNNLVDRTNTLMTAQNPEWSSDVDFNEEEDIIKIDNLI